METPEGTSTTLDDLRASARGWHGVQLAVLGFIGLCGVLQGGAGEGNPRWLQVLAGLLVLAALVLACSATALVASAAWPVYGGAPPPAGAEPARTGRRLRTGIVLTFVAVAVLAVAATSSWWPRGAGGGPGGGTGEAAAALVEVATSGGTVCGVLRDGGAGRIAVDVDGRRVAVALAAVSRVRQVSRC